MSSRSCSCFALVLLALFGSLAASASASVAAVVVTTSADTIDSGDGKTSLREAIIAANASGPADITFDTASFAGTAPYTLQLTGVLPDLNTGVTLNGPGAEVLTIRGEGVGNPYRIFHVASSGTLTLSGVTIANGCAKGTDGAAGTATGIGGGATPVTSPGNGLPGFGGAIYNEGTLQVIDCVFSGNTAQGGAGGSGAGDTTQNGGIGASASGGAIYSIGLGLSVTRCSFVGNAANGGGGGAGGSIQFGGGQAGNGSNAGDGFGGAICIGAGPGSFAITSSTFSNNTAQGGFGGSGGVTNFTNGALKSGGTGGTARGGAISTQVTVTLTSCTLALNNANAGNGGLQGANYTNANAGNAAGGGIHQTGGATLGNTLVAANNATNPGNGLAQGPDVFGTFTSQNFNLIGTLTGDASGFNGTADQSGTSATPLDARVDPAGATNNGGHTLTVRLRRGSPAVDKGKDLLGLGTDQLGNVRPHELTDVTYPNAAGGDGSDIGAWEAEALPDDKPTTFDQQITGLAGSPLAPFQLQANDADSDPLTFALANSDTMPDGLTLNSDGTVTGTPTSPGTTQVHFVANDGLQDSDVHILTITINETPSLVVTTDIDNSTNSDGLTSLREAIGYAVSGGAPSTNVTFDSTFFATAKIITLSQSSGSLVLTGSVSIQGPAAGVEISGGDLLTVFTIYGFGSPVTVAFSDVTIAHGHANPFNTAGGLSVNNFGSAPVVNFTRCTLSANSADDAQGAAIFNNGGTLTLANCTLAGNHADMSANSSAGGAALFQSAGSAVFNDCTIALNHATGGTGGGIVNVTGTVTLANTILAANTAATGPDLSGTATSGGFNLLGNATGTVFVPTTGDQVGVDPGLDPTALAANGGAVKTIKLAPSSVAIDAGKATAGVTTDARGVVRPQDNPLITNVPGGDGSDIGAYEELAGGPEIVVEQPAGTDLADGVSSVSFGNVTVGGFADLVFTIRNTGTTDLTLTGTPKVELTGPDAADFMVTATPSSPLAPAASTTFTVRFMPAAAGAKLAAISMASDDADENPFDIALSGTGLAPEIRVQDDQGTGLTDGASTVDFGTVPVGTSKDLVFTIFNDGNADLTLGGTPKVAVGGTNAGSFTVIAEPTSPVTAGSSTTFTVRFAPAALGPQTATLSIANNDTDETPFDFNLIGGGGRPLSAVSSAVIAQGADAPGAGTAGGPPAAAKLTSFNVPAIDDAGNVAYIARFATTPKVGGTGLFTGICLGVSGGQVPGITGATYKTFSDPVIENGNVATIATLGGTTKGAVLRYATNGTPTVVARLGEAATPDGAKFKAFKSVDLVGDYTAMFAQLTPGTGTAPKTTAANDLGVWVKDGAAPLTLVLREGQTIAGKKVGTLVSFAYGNGSPGQGRGWLRENNLVPGAQVLARVVFTDKSQGIVLADTGDPANPQILSLSGQSGDGSPAIDAQTFASYSLPTLTRDDRNTFLASLTVSAAGGVTKATAPGIFLKPALTGDYDTLVRVGDPAAVPGVAGAKFSVLKDPIISEDGDLAFPATLAGGGLKGITATTLWWKPLGLSVHLAAQGGKQPGSDLPAGTQWKAFPSLAIAGGGGAPVFTGTLVVGKGGTTAANATGVWTLQRTGDVRLLFRAGVTQVGGKTVKTFSLLKASAGSAGVTRSLNDSAEVIWLATFTDKTQAIVKTLAP